MNASAKPWEHHRVETAGRIMTRRVPITRLDETLRDLRRRLSEGEFEAIDPVLAVDAAGKFIGVVGMRGLLDRSPDRPVAELVDPSWPSVAPTLDQEHVAEIARRGGLTGVPVVSADGRPLGCVTATRLLDVLWHEHTEDLHRLAGILLPRQAAREALDQAPPVRAWRRLPWLLVGIAGSAVATAVMSGFEHALERNVKIAFFIPAIVYLADAIGTQTETIAVRGLSLKRQPLARLIGSEVATGAIIGVVLGLLVYAAVAFAYGDPRFAAAVALAVAAAGIAATAIGSALPWLLDRAGLDPAFGSGPLATIIQDVLTLLIYFAAVAALM